MTTAGVPTSAAPPSVDEMLNYGSRKRARPCSRNLPEHAVLTLTAWLAEPKHFDYPYPTENEKQELLRKTGISRKQLANWFTNARKRVWAQMRKRRGQPLIDYSSVREHRKKDRYSPRNSTKRDATQAGFSNPPGKHMRVQQEKKQEPVLHYYNVPSRETSQAPTEVPKVLTASHVNTANGSYVFLTGNAPKHGSAESPTTCPPPGTDGNDARPIQSQPAPQMLSTSTPLQPVFAPTPAFSMPYQNFHNMVPVTNQGPSVLIPPISSDMAFSTISPNWFPDPSQQQIQHQLQQPFQHPIQTPQQQQPYSMPVMRVDTMQQPQVFVTHTSMTPHPRMIRANPSATAHTSCPPVTKTMVSVTPSVSMGPSANLTPLASTLPTPDVLKSPKSPEIFSSKSTSSEQSPFPTVCEPIRTPDVSNVFRSGFSPVLDDDGGDLLGGLMKDSPIFKSPGKIEALQLDDYSSNSLFESEWLGDSLDGPLDTDLQMEASI